MKILHISPDFNYSCGRSKLIFLYLKHFSEKPEYKMHLITNGGNALNRLKEIPFVSYKEINYSEGIRNIFYYRKFYKELRQYVIDNGINLIHTHHRFPELVAVKIAKELNTKTVTSAHSFVAGYKKISFKSDRIISVSNSISAYLIKNFNVRREKLSTLYNPIEKISAIDTETKAKLRIELGLNPENKILLFMGRINLDKGYDTLLKSFQLIKNKFPNAVLLLCGKIEDKNFNKVNLNSSIKYIQPQKDNYLLYSIADLVVLPSRVDPFPFVMIESGTYMKPFIGGNTGGIAEFIDDGKNGLLVNPEDHIELVEKIIYLLQNTSFAKNLGVNLNKKVMEQCDYNDYFSQIENIYNSLLSTE